MAKRKRKAKKAKVNKLVVFCGVVIMTLAVLITLADKITLPFYVPTWDELSSMVNPQAQLDEEGRTHLEVHAIDVGQGDSIYIKAGSKNILIDAGENDQGPTVSKYLRELGVDRLDLVVGTHPHSDHIGGLDYIIEQFKVSSVLLPSLPESITPTTKTYLDMLEAIAEKGVKVRKAEVGLSFDFDDVKIKVLGPVAEYEDLNDMSVVLRVEYKENSFLFMGDAETSAEKGLLMQNEEALDADVLKVGHHGSKTSTSAKFLEAVDPRYGVICVGEGNSYGHPTPAIIKRLQDAGVVIYRTDESGSIVFYADGNTISVKCEK